jgi:hypothetical protein
MYKIVLSFGLILVMIISGCSNTSNFQKDSKQIYNILVDYMKNGKSITTAQQRQIDYYISDPANKINNLSDEDRKLFIHITTMDVIRQRYDLQDKNNDKKQEIMQKFLDEEKIVNEILK